jgi:acetyl-CoA/propionyl-CoA carboxylase biotin carboxyl carrier protein
VQKVLIANRGEIAVRIIRACDDAALDSVAVYADVDADALHVAEATEAYALDGNSPADTYLNVNKLLGIAMRSGADAVHPGYGFLSENADFAQAVLDAGLVWIGPTPESIRVLGNKVSAREIAIRVGAPLVAGSEGTVESGAEVRAFAEEHGLPVAIKAAFGGGGRGMKVVWKLDEVEEAFGSAVRESQAAFGRGECFVERFLHEPRHVEAQILADGAGNVIVVGTRDCSLQRRNQKLVEEAPAPFLTPEQREQVYSSAKAICREAGYTGAGTVEYLLGRDGSVSFLEVNTRLQVEHPITEQTSGIDLVLAQLQIAGGGPLPVRDDPEPRGHAFEFRINAEDPGRGFLPSPGTVTRFVTPTGPGIRVDSGVREGGTVPAQFDSLLAKLIVTGADRQQALRRARRALKAFEIEGLPTVLPFHRAVVMTEAFSSTDGLGVHTGWIEGDFAETIDTDPAFHPVAPESDRRTISIDLDGKRMSLGLPAALLAGLARGAGPGAASDAEPAVPETVDPTSLCSTMSGTVVKWLVEEGATVAEGEAVLVLEAMKMESIVAAHRSGALTGKLVQIGDAVSAHTAVASVVN